MQLRRDPDKGLGLRLRPDGAVLGAQPWAVRAGIAPFDVITAVCLPAARTSHPPPPSRLFTRKRLRAAAAAAAAACLCEETPGCCGGTPLNRCF